MASVDLKAKAEDVRTRGYCVLERAYTEEECAQMRGHLDRAIADRGPHSQEKSVISCHPLFDFSPDMAPFFGKSLVVDAMAEVLQDDVCLSHNGAGVWANEFAGPHLSPWHVHYAWDVPDGGLQRDVPERILCNIYVDGSGEAIGPLVVLPRELNDPIDALDEGDKIWPGEETVIIPPGSCVIFDTALWHCGRRGTSGGLRHLCGGHYQGWHNERAHVEDNSASQPELDAHKDVSPGLRGLIEGP